ncbi:hypothetical protein F3Y22_tig00110607pilonHSYRG00109 [Hibiscus syriacus]|uniref:Uncharacterized protein n=1 Tax=Hibiscus syriacus TaxID=106335 RepID=A0A6A3A0W7_HIBSY|nr:uncharacterized protein LOC120135320 [Hibiscus syriacus]KAE8697941.1 hypothetical protein F3Y22_tig00110607pilonHSYRG00109 [Hibiscus syriacus]
MDLTQNLNNNHSTGTGTGTGTGTHLSSSYNDGDHTETPRFNEDFGSTCSTPYVSAPSSSGRGPSSGYFFSAPASPMYFILSSSSSPNSHLSSDSSFVPSQSDASSLEFEFSSRFSSNGSVTAGSMSSADELFLNGQIRPMKLSFHLQRPQNLAPLLDLDVEEDDEGGNKQDASRGRDLKLRSRSLHRKARSLSPLRNPYFQWEDEKEEQCNREERKEVNKLILEGLKETDVSKETTPSSSASSSRSSSSGRNSKKWIFLKDLLYRSKSEGRANGKEKFWTSISFSPSKEKKAQMEQEKPPPLKRKQKEIKQGAGNKAGSGKPSNSVAKRRVPPSPHELHYTTNRAQAEEMKKRTYLPYRQGLFGCLSFSSKSYGALNGLARSLNPVSSS